MDHIVALVLFLISMSSGCRFVEKASAQVERTLYKDGLHRELETHVWVTPSILSLDGCSVAIKEDLPASVYVDPEEMRRLEMHGLVPPHFVGTDVDIEAGDWDSAPIPVVFYPSLTHVTFDHSDDVSWFANFTSPIHVRYHRARSASSPQGTMASIKILHPSVLVSCPQSVPDECLLHVEPLPCPPNSQSSLLWPQEDNAPQKYSTTQEKYPRNFQALPTCAWLPVHSFSTTEGVLLSIPVGDSDLLQLVFIITTSVTCAATFLLLAPLFKKL